MLSDTKPFTFQDQIDALRYVAENHGHRLVSIEFRESTEDNTPRYVFVYHSLSNENVSFQKRSGNIDELVNQEILRFQNGG